MRGLVAVLMLASCDKVLGLTPLSDAAICQAQLSVGAAFPYFAYGNEAHTGSATYYELSVTPPPNACAVNLLLASMVCAGNPTTVPVIASVTYEGTPLAPVTMLNGTAASNSPQSLVAQYALLEPPASGTLAVRLASSGVSMHVSALLFGGVDTSAPFTATNGSTGFGIASVVTVPTTAGQLVESVTGEGTLIDGPGSGAQVIYLDNFSNGNALDNSAASMMPASSSTTTTVEWKYEPTNQDTYITVAAALSPQPPQR